VSDWLGVVQVVLTVVAVFFAWKALGEARATTLIAREAQIAANREWELGRLERVRGLVGELERLHRWGDDTRKREQTQDELATLMPSLGSHRRLPKTMALAHWNPKLENAENLLDEARLEVDAAIDKRLQAS
jgi:hypothetical protein